MNNIKIEITVLLILITSFAYAGTSAELTHDSELNDIANYTESPGYDNDNYTTSVDYDAETDYPFNDLPFEFKPFMKDFNLQPQSINYQDSKGQTLLMMIAAQDNQKRIMQFTLEQLLANPNVKNRQGQTALHFAVMSGKTFVVKSLLQHNALIDVQDHEGKTPLYCAVEKNYVGIANLLLQQGADRRLGIFETGELPQDKASTPAMRMVFSNNPTDKDSNSLKFYL